MLDDRHIVYVDQVESSRPVRMFNRIGNRVPAHASAAGKAMLACAGDDVEARWGSAALPALTARTIADMGALRAELRRVRAAGYAFDDGELDEGVVCSAAAIAHTSPLAALSISGPAERMRRLDRDAVGSALRDAAAELAQLLGRPE